MQIGNIATAYFTVAIAFHTFNSLVLKKRQSIYVYGPTIILGWTASLAVGENSPVKSRLALFLIWLFSIRSPYTTDGPCLRPFSARMWGATYFSMAFILLPPSPSELCCYNHELTTNRDNFQDFCGRCTIRDTLHAYIPCAARTHCHQGKESRPESRRVSEFKHPLPTVCY